MACPVCFGDSNEPMALATNQGIWFMLGIVALMISAFATFFIRLIRRANALARETDTAPQPSSYVRGQEGTA